MHRGKEKYKHVLLTASEEKRLMGRTRCRWNVILQ